jgi:hypothetical protein
MIVTGLEFALITILIGVVVGKAIRHASHGLGGRPQQILAVVLTYFAITTSYLPAAISQASKHRPAQTAQSGQQGSPSVAESSQAQGKPSLAGAILFLLLIGAAAPFLSLTSGVGGLLSLFIVFIGLHRAWKLTARSELLVMGPYDLQPAQ